MKIRWPFLKYTSNRFGLALMVCNTPFCNNGNDELRVISLVASTSVCFFSHESSCETSEFASLIFSQLRYLILTLINSKKQQNFINGDNCLTNNNNIETQWYVAYFRHWRLLSGVKLLTRHKFLLHVLQIDDYYVPRCVAHPPHYNWWASGDVQIDVVLALAITNDTLFVVRDPLLDGGLRRYLEWFYHMHAQDRVRGIIEGPWEGGMTSL